MVDIKKFYSVPQKSEGTDVSSSKTENANCTPRLDKLISAVKQQDSSVPHNLPIIPVNRFPIQSASGEIFFLPLLSQEIIETMEVTKEEVYPQNEEIQEMIKIQPVAYVCSLSGKVLDPSLPHMRYIHTGDGRRFLLFTS